MSSALGRREILGPQFVMPMIHVLEIPSVRREGLHTLDSICQEAIQICVGGERKDEHEVHRKLSLYQSAAGHFTAYKVLMSLVATIYRSRNGGIVRLFIYSKIYVIGRLSSCTKSIRTQPIVSSYESRQIDIRNCYSLL